PHHGLDLWLQVQIFYDHVDYTTQMAIDYATGGRLKKLRPEEAWETIEDSSLYEEEGWNDPVILKEGSLDSENPDIEQLLGVIKYKVDTLMKEAISLMGRSKGVFRMTSNEMYQLPPKPSRQEKFEHTVTNFILDQEERVKQLKEYMDVIMGDFMQLSSKVTRRLKEKIIEEWSRMRKIEKITRYPENEDPKPSINLKFSESLTKSTSFHAPDFISPKSLCVKYVRTIFPSPPLVRESTFGFKPGANNNQNVKSRYDVENTSPQSTPQVLPSIPPVTYPKEVENTLGTPIEVEPLNETKLEEVGLNCNHNTPLSSREVSSFDGPEPQPLLNSPSINVSLGDVIDPEPPIKPHSPDSSRIKEMFDDDWGLESKEVSTLEEELSLFDRPNKVERGRILEAHRLESILQQ
ncbi:hypothetical protein Tco_0623443, partial [Tanacetum coccineum]